MRLLLLILLAAAPALASAHATEGVRHLVALHASQPIGTALDQLPRFQNHVTRLDHPIYMDWQDTLAGDAGEVIVQKARGQLDVTPVPANIPEPPVAFLALGGVALVSLARRKI